MHPHFPESDAPRGTREMDPSLGRSLATTGDPLTDAALAELLAEHAAFLASGGGGGRWELLSVAGLPLCVYRGSGTAGKQLVLRHSQIASGTKLDGRDLSSSDFSGCLAEGVDFQRAKLDGSVAIDAFFHGTDFSGASLRGVDFSGSDLRGCSFVAADLMGADFEHTDCTGADFSHANVERARFPGAILDGVVRHAPVKATFLERIEGIVTELRADPRVIVHDFVVRPPATSAEIEAATAAFGAPLPAALEAFYRAHDGIFLQWGLRDRTYERTAPFGHPDYHQPPGSINLMPVASAWSPEWQKIGFVNIVADEQLVHMFGSAPDPALPVGAVVIDDYAKYHHADLVLGDADGLVVVSTDHGADMDSSDFVDFETYLDVVVALFGTCRYQDALGIGWTRKSRRVATWSQRFSLDEIIARVEAAE